METLSPGYWQEQNLELGTLAPLDEAISSRVWSSPDMLASQGENPGPLISMSLSSLSHSPIISHSCCFHPVCSLPSLPHNSSSSPSDILVLSVTPPTSLAPTPPSLAPVQRPLFPLHLFPKIKWFWEDCIMQNKEVLEGHDWGRILQKERDNGITSQKSLYGEK